MNAERTLIAQALSSCGADEVCISDFTKAIWSNDGAGAPGLGDLTTPGGIITRLIPYLFSFGGLIVFVMLIWGGMEILLGASNPKSAEAGKQRITSALIGFALLFGSFWIAQIIQVMFGISLGLGN